MTPDDLRVEEQLEAAAARLGDEIVAVGTPPAWELPFRLARRLRGVPGADASFARDPQVIYPAVAAFCRILDALPSDGRDLDFSESAHEAVYVETVAAWDKVRRPGTGALAAALHQADQHPIVLLPPLDAYGSTFRRIMSAAYWLQVYRKREPILLPVRPLGMLLGLNHTTVSAHLRLARRRDLLMVVAEFVFQKGKKGRARSYRFNLDSPLYRRPSVEGAEPPAGANDACRRPREPGEDDDDPTPAVDVDALLRARVKR